MVFLLKQKISFICSICVFFSGPGGIAIKSLACHIYEPGPIPGAGKASHIDFRDVKLPKPYWMEIW